MASGLSAESASPLPRRAGLGLAGLALFGLALLAAGCAAPPPEPTPAAPPRPAASGVPRYGAVLVRVVASLDGRPQAVDRANVVGLVRYLGDLGAFRGVYAPEALDAGLESAARIELEEHYASGATLGERSEMEATTLLRVQLPGPEPPVELEARAHGAAGRGGQARQALIARLQQSNLENLGAQLRAEPRLFTPAPALP